jgi:dihydroneopterin aldolase
MLTIQLDFLKLKAESLDDNLQNTICYHTLIDNIRAEFRDKEFKLIETFAHELVKLIKAKVQVSSPYYDLTRIKVTVSKKPSLIADFNGTSKFRVVHKI